MSGDTDDERPTVLVVDDEKRVADTFAAALSTDYDTEAVYGGQAALDRLGPDVDVVLLDRRMPDVSGDEVLQELRDGELDVGVVLVTAVDPTESDMDLPFDEYVVKPVDVSVLAGTVEQLLAVRDYEDTFGQYLTVTSKMTLMEAEMSSSELAESSAYERLSAEADRLEKRLHDERDDAEDVVDWLRGSDKLDSAF